MDWTTALPDWEQRITSGKSLLPCEPLFPEEALGALNVFCELKIVDAIGQPTFGEVGGKWLLDFVAAIFGAYDNANETRLINEFFLCVSKKNGKSVGAAGIMLTALIRNQRQSNELIIVAPTIKAAENSFKPAADMVRADPRLNADGGNGGFLHVVDHLRQIVHLGTKATLRVLAADTGTVAGNKAAFVLIDELWEFGKRNRADAMMREAAGGLVTRPEGFLISITTQSDEAPAGIFKAKLDYARDVRDGKIVDKKFLPVIYEFPKRMIDAEEFLQEKNFHITNPYIGNTDWGRGWIADELQKEMAKGPETRNVFLAKHLNVEIGMNYRANRWPGAEYWTQRADPTLTLETLLERSEVVVVGIDGGGLDDLFGLALLGRDKKTKDWLAWCHAWCHVGVLQRRQSIASALRDFAARGELTIVDDRLDDLTGIIEIIDRVREAGLLVEVAVDPLGLGELVDALASIDVTQENKLLVAVGQGYRLMSAIKTAERRLANGTLWHSPSSLMDWCVGNVKIEPTATAIQATKQNAGDAKVDPWFALINAHDRMSLNPGGQEYQAFILNVA